MAIRKGKRPGRQLSPRNGAGLKEKAADSVHQKPPAPNREEEQLLLPHDRDEATGSESTGSATTSQESRDTIKQAVEDIEHGLKDTERRGIPSDVPPGRGRRQRRS
ncbi:MAG: hypothetical protein ACREUR_06875 [Nitrosospira sp.]